VPEGVTFSSRRSASTGVVERGCKVSKVHVHWLSVFVAILALRPGLSSATMMAGSHTTSGPVDAPRNIAAPDQQPTFRTSNIWLSARVAHGDALEHARSYRLYNEPQEIVVMSSVGRRVGAPSAAGSVRILSTSACSSGQHSFSNKSRKSHASVGDSTVLFNAFDHQPDVISFDPRVLKVAKRGRHIGGRHDEQDIPHLLPSSR